MGIKTSRADEPAHVYIENDKCTLCGQCVNICGGKPLYISDGKVQVDQSRLFGCIGCGHCMAICPQNCITVEGRCLSPNDMFDLHELESKADYSELTGLMMTRRSVRRYLDKAVEQDKINKILEAASSAPSGYPPSDVQVLVINGRGKVKQFAFDTIDAISGMKWVFSPIMQLLLRPFVSKEIVESFKTFLYPACNFFTASKEKDEDYLLYGAPTAILFYGSPYSDPCDPYIAATYAMLAAESLGLGSCMIGSVGPFLKRSKKLRRKYKITGQVNEALVLICGYPAIKFQRGIKRTFADVKYL